MASRVCKKCHKHKPPKLMSRANPTWCKACHAAYMRAYRLTPKGHEVSRGNAKKYYDSHKRERHDYSRSWRAANRDRHRAYHREYARMDRRRNPLTRLKELARSKL